MDGPRSTQAPPDSPQQTPANGQPLGRIIPQRMTPEQLARARAEQQAQAQAALAARRQRRATQAGLTNPSPPPTSYAGPQGPQGIGAPVEQPRTRDQTRELLRRLHNYAKAQGWSTMELLAELDPEAVMTDELASRTFCRLAQGIIATGREHVEKATSALSGVGGHLTSLEQFLGQAQVSIAAQAAAQAAQDAAPELEQGAEQLEVSLPAVPEPEEAAEAHDDDDEEDQEDESA